MPRMGGHGFKSAAVMRTTMSEVHVLPTSGEVASTAADHIVALATWCVETQGRFTIALSGGSTPRQLYRRLASPPYADRIPWGRWHVFWSDERCVPPDHQDSNYRMARETLLDPVAIPTTHIHRMRGEATPQEAAEEYERELRKVFRSSRPTLDLVLLGIGQNGHTASLFPGTDGLREQARLVVANWVPHLNAHRLTFTPPIINAASQVAFLATDGSKAEAVGRVLQPTADGPAPPAALVRPVRGSVHWFLSNIAASQLTGATV